MRWYLLVPDPQAALSQPPRTQAATSDACPQPPSTCLAQRGFRSAAACQSPCRCTPSTWRRVTRCCCCLGSSFEPNHLEIMPPQSAYMGFWGVFEVSCAHYAHAQHVWAGAVFSLPCPRVRTGLHFGLDRGRWAVETWHSLTCVEIWLGHRHVGAEEVVSAGGVQMRFWKSAPVWPASLQDMRCDQVPIGAVRGSTSACL